MLVLIDLVEHPATSARVFWSGHNIPLVFWNRQRPHRVSFSITVSVGLMRASLGTTAYLAPLRTQMDL